MAEGLPRANDNAFYIKSLKSNECPGCDGYKKERKSLCYKCYKSLPNDMQRALYKRFGSGYREALDDALKYLEAGINK